VRCLNPNEKADSMNAKSARENTNTYVKMLRGVWNSWNTKNRNKPITNETQRAIDFNLNRFGGIGMNHTMAQIMRNKKRFKAFTVL
jgi:hypothetical protein